MVYLHSSISVCNPVDQAMPAPSHSSRATTRSSSSPPTCSSFPVCQGSHSAAIDVLILIAVITSCAFLFFPYAKLIALASISIFSHISLLVNHEILHNPIVYGAGSPIAKGLGRLLSLIFRLRLRIASKAALIVVGRRGGLSCLVSITVSWRLS
ncbi:uncharacterized protein BNAA05G34040D isoform X2 [Brassica napus]|uniref:uncharacterized protein BNAA05G34040D isoform X2 n=1 Tax=Brassica napus TaxID=3708 RepID=UPI002079FDA0|nr:uncharacterized protein BNAA05G34040D isoform X2 [Brassica napus]